MISALFSHYHLLVCILLFSLGLCAIWMSHNLIRQLIGLSLLQGSVLLFYVSAGKILGGKIPIFEAIAVKAGQDTQLYSNPVPQVLMLTAIVVGVATLALGLSLAVRVYSAYQTVEEDQISTQLPQKNEAADVE